MKIRVVILLCSQAGFLNTYHPSKDSALKFIRAWMDRQSERIATGQFDKVETNLYSDAEGGWSVMGAYIIGMYIPSDEPSPASRMADVMEKSVNEGEDWRNK